MNGQIGILNVGAGDTKLSFDKNNPVERIRAARIVTDMLRRGYALLVEVERDGVKKFERALAFDENTCEYIIADFDPIEAAKPRIVTTKENADDGAVETEATATGGEEAAEAVSQGGAVQPATKPRRGRPSKRIDAGSTRAVAVARSAGG